MKTKALRKIFITTMTMFILITIFSIPKLNEEKTIHTNLEIKEMNNYPKNSIYLLNNNNYLVKKDIIIDSNNKIEKIYKILNNLIVTEPNKNPKGLKGTIPEGTKINNIFCGNKLVTIDFSKEFYNMKETIEKQIIASIVYSILSIDDIEGINILVDGKKLKYYPKSKETLPEILDKKIGINKEFSVKNLNNINNVVVYYLENIEDDLYYVPVTKYINDERDKIKIIIEELTTSYIYEENLMSFLNDKTRLIDYKEENDILILNFNDYIFDEDDKILEEVLYSISYSVFDNYNVGMVLFEVNGKKVGHVNRI